MLTENEPKVINGPEILNKYVGQSGTFCLLPWCDMMQVLLHLVQLVVTSLHLSWHRSSVVFRGEYP